MYYGDSYFNSQNNPFAVQQPQQQQQQQGMQINPMQALQAYNMFSGGGAAGGASGGGGMGGLTSMFGGGGAASGGAASSGAAGGSGASGATSALASNPIGWIAAAALAQNVAHNKGIASWQSALKGQAGAAAGDHFMLDQWGMDEGDALYDVAGALGFGRGGGVFNPSYLSEKLFGKVD